MSLLFHFFLQQILSINNKLASRCPEPWVSFHNRLAPCPFCLSAHNIISTAHPSLVLASKVQLTNPYAHRIPHPPLVNRNTVYLSSFHVSSPSLVSMSAVTKDHLFFNPGRAEATCWPWVTQEAMCTSVGDTQTYPLISTISCCAYASSMQSSMHVCTHFKARGLLWMSFLRVPSTLLSETESFRSQEFTNSARLTDTKPKGTHSSPPLQHWKGKHI